MPGAVHGDIILINFTSRTKNGEIFEAPGDDGPVQVKLGEGKINSAFEKALSGMNPGEKKEIMLTSEEAYGEHKKRLVFKMRRSGLSLKCDPKPGDFLTIKLPTGQSSLVKVLELNKKTIKVDANHPMAGKDLIYELNLVDILPKK